MKEETPAGQAGAFQGDTTNGSNRNTNGANDDGTARAVGYAGAAPVYLEAGWAPFPLPAGQKLPPPVGATGRGNPLPSAADCHAWADDPRHAGGNTALRMPPTVVGIDVDDYGDKPGAATLAGWEFSWGQRPATWRSSARGADTVSGIYYYRIPAGVELSSNPDKGVEIVQHHHRYAVVAPSQHPDTGRRYRWYDPAGQVCGPPRVDQLPELPAAWLDGLQAAKHGDRDQQPSAAPPSAVAGDDRLRRYALNTLEREAAELAGMAPETGRNNKLNDAALRCYRLADGAGMDRAIVTATLRAAAQQSGTPGIEGTLRSAATKADADGPAYPPDNDTRGDWDPGSTDVGDLGAGGDGGDGGDGGQRPARAITLTPASQIRDDVPTWAWTHNGAGRILQRALTMFGGRPGAGKSTAARWFAAGYSLGTIPGCWEGQPQTVAYLASEESIEHMVKPSLRAHGADLDRVHFITVELPDGTTSALSALGDENALTAALIAAGVTVVIVDPIMATIGATVDTHRSNETRAYLEPWVRIAEAINGVVLGIAHLKKDRGGDVVDALMGSSAFGEVPRCVFGFAKDPDSADEHRIMSQAKNSAGREDLSIAYQLTGTTVTTDSGKTAEVPRFVVVGDSDRRVEDVLADAAGGRKTSKGDLAAEWLKGFTAAAGRPIESANVKALAGLDGHTERTIQRAASKLGYAGKRNGFQGASQWGRPS
ncbi:AAA family ATPase [Mycolicibacter sinensis]